MDDVLHPQTLFILQEVPNAIYQQNNARQHITPISQYALQGTQVLPLPLVFLDLSLFEHVCDMTGRSLHVVPLPRSKVRFVTCCQSGMDIYPSRHHEQTHCVYT